MVVEASALGDLALRTWVASLLSTTVAPFVVDSSEATQVRRARSPRAEASTTIR
ncbi:hypothetical protein JHV675_51420 [Mycobacterium avium subsp. hominissuis]